MEKKFKTGIISPTGYCNNIATASLQKKVYVAGHMGMVGSALVRALAKSGCENIVTRTRSELDLTDQAAVRQFFVREQPEVVYLAAAKVGGIYANTTYPADFIYDNLMIATNVVNSAFRSGVKKLLFIGSICSYPKLALQPISEDSILTGSLEPTNEPYAMAKISGIKLCESYNRQYGESHGVDYRTIMPTNAYGPGDNYHLENSHVIPALIRRFHEARLALAPSVTIWGTGEIRREFIFVDDLADAALFVMNLPDSTYRHKVKPMLSQVNVGFGEDIKIIDLARLVAEVVGYSGRIECDTTKVDGAPRKLTDCSKLQSMGWNASTKLDVGLRKAYDSFLQNCR
jgi:GDP-L-fucose synthase